MSLLAVTLQPFLAAKIKAVLAIIIWPRWWLLGQTRCFKWTGQKSQPVRVNLETLILGDNLIDFVLDVTEEACEAECEIMPGCNFYTYHNGNSSTYPDTCFFLTELRDMVARWL